VNASQRLEKRKKARGQISRLSQDSSHTLAIHYSCESFYDIVDGRTPRITAIAVRFLQTGQSIIFSIHKIAEKRHVAFNQIEQHYDVLEKEMLSDFFAFVKKHGSFKWVHWNMRDINYGFEAIEHRYMVLGGRPIKINDDQKFDLARLLVDIYGLRYIGHPRMEKLVDKNRMTKKDFLTGAEEAKAFTNKEYVKLHQSTLRKVDLLHTLFEKVSDGSLKTDAKFQDTYGISIQGAYLAVKDNWAFWVVTLILGAVLGAVIGKL